MPGREFTSAAGYRYGFNGQERDDEISGSGNVNTAEFWEYDTRLGRRWNLDPKPNASVSSYAVFENNPIWLTDILGDTVGINLFGSWEKTWHRFVSRHIKKQTAADNIFIAYSHGTPSEVIYGLYADPKLPIANRFKNASATTPESVMSLLLRNSDFKEAMDKQKEIVLILTACNSGKDDFDQYGNVTDASIARELSKAYPNITVKAPDGYFVVTVDSKNNVEYVGIDNGKDTGSWISYKNGEIIATQQDSRNQETKKDSGRLRKIFKSRKE